MPGNSKTEGKPFILRCWVDLGVTSSQNERDGMPHLVQDGCKFFQFTEGAEEKQREMKHSTKFTDHWVLPFTINDNDDENTVATATAEEEAKEEAKVGS